MVGIILATVTKPLIESGPRFGFRAANDQRNARRISAGHARKAKPATCAFALQQTTEKPPDRLSCPLFAPCSSGTKPSREIENGLLPAGSVVGRAGLEPATGGL
jgi:hypothetical protein